MKDEQYLNLKSLMDEENEHVDKVTLEMTRLLKIIAEDQEIIYEKDKTIEELKSNVGNREDDLKTKFETKIVEYKQEKLEMANEIDEMKKENKSQVEDLKKEIDNLQKIVKQKECEIEKLKIGLEKQEEIFSTYESLKSKIKDSMYIIEQKSLEIERIQSLDKDGELSQSKEENSKLKDAIKSSELAIARLEKIVHEKEMTIADNNDSIKKLSENLDNIKADNALQEQIHNKSILENNLLLNDYRTMKEKHKLEIESTKAEITKLKDESSRCLRLKEEEIEKLETEILKEKQIVAQVQINQEKDILEKDGEIKVLNTILTQERKILLEKEAEVEKLKTFRIPFQKCGVQMESPKPAPARPPRTKSLVISARMQVLHFTNSNLFVLFIFLFLSRNRLIFHLVQPTMMTIVTLLHFMMLLIVN